MTYKSTRGGEHGLPFEHVLLSAYASDGGLYVPERLPHVLVRCVREAYGLPFVEWFMASVLGCREYAVALRGRGMTVRELELRSSHWTMLTDPQLLQFLSDEFSSGCLRAR